MKFGPIASIVSILAVALQAIAVSSPGPANEWTPFLRAFRATTVPVLLPSVRAGFPAFVPPFRRTGRAEPGRVYPTIHAERDGYSVTVEQIPERCDGAIGCVQMTIDGSRRPDPDDMRLTGKRVSLGSGVAGLLQPADAYGHASIVWERAGIRYRIVDHGFGPQAVVAAAKSALAHGPYR